MLNIEEIKARTEKASKGPWNWQQNRHPNCNGTPWGWIKGPAGNMCWSGVQSKIDADFIAHAREDIPVLLAEVERLTKENNSLAANGGKYMEIAQRRYEMVEEASKRAEDYEIDNAAKDQRIATLNKALEIAGKTLEKNFPPTKAQNWIDMWEQQAQEQEANHG